MLLPLRSTIDNLWPSPWPCWTSVPRLARHPTVVLTSTADQERSILVAPTSDAYSLFFRATYQRVEHHPEAVGEGSLSSKDPRVTCER